MRINADPFRAILATVQDGALVSITTTSEPLLFAIPHLYKLSAYSIVIHVMLSQGSSADYSVITALRQTGFSILQSSSLQEVQDIAIVSHSLALSSGKGVIHFSETSQDDIPIAAESIDTITSMFARYAIQRSHRPQAATDSDNTIYRRDAEERNAVKLPSHNPDTSTSSSGNGVELHLNGANGVSNGNGTGGQDGIAELDLSSSDLGNSAYAAAPVDPSLVNEIFNLFHRLVGRLYRCFEYTGPSNPTHLIVVFGSCFNNLRLAVAEAGPSDIYNGVGLVFVRLCRPWLASEFWDCVPRSVANVAVVEQLQHRTTNWGPIFIDVLLSSHGRSVSKNNILSYQIGEVLEIPHSELLGRIVKNLQSDTPQKALVIGGTYMPHLESRFEQPQLEIAYIKVLQQLFGENLHILNHTASSHGVSDQFSSSPEYILGEYLADLKRRRKLTNDVSAEVRKGNLWHGDLNSLMSLWVSETSHSQTVEENSMAAAVEQLRHQSDPLSQSLAAHTWLFKSEVPWIIGSESWAFDIGSSGVHHLLASGANVNMLIIDSQPYSQRGEGSLGNRKKDIGLYAMNFGNAYVASVAIYSSYTQVMHAMIEAQQHHGPSVILAYLPYTSEIQSPLHILQETKMAVDSGYWPLYRWAPSDSVGGDPSFQLDSERVKKELKAFIDRENHLTHLVKGKVSLSPYVSHSHGSEQRRLKKVKAKEAIESLVEGLSGPPVTILFASDGGNAEGIAKRIGRRGKARGLKPKLMAMDDFPIEDLVNEKNVIFCTSTAGQGEFPQNGREMWDGLKNSTDLDLSRINYGVFALGDSHYWPRKEDKIYYNKPGKDLDARLAELGGIRLLPVGLGDDQDPDGYETGYSLWESQLWKTLGVDQVDAEIEEPKPLTNEDIKIASNFLRGTIAQGLADTSTGAIAESDAQLTKFHGTYMQDDRDLRDERKAQGLEPAYMFMVRVRMSGGVCQPEQWVAMDEISTKWGNETFKLVSYHVQVLLNPLDDSPNLSIPWVQLSSADN